MNRIHYWRNHCVRSTIVAVLPAVIVISLCTNSPAATVTYVGSQLNLGSPAANGTNGSAAGWRTSSVAKAHDIDGNNVYGSLGYYLFNPHAYGSPGLGNHGGFPLANAMFSLPSYISVNATGADISYQANYTTIDNPSNPAGPPIWSGLGYRGSASGNVETGLFSVTFGAGVPANTKFRLGIFVDNAAPIDGSPIGLRVTGAGGDSLLVAKPQATQVNNYYFFDLEDVSAGDVFSIIAKRPNSGPGPLTLGGLTFDSVAVPEPSGFMLAVMAFGILAGIGKRRS